MKMLTSPRGSSATEERISAITRAVWAAWAGILRTTLHPAASAGATERIER
jgi:hypothetical protein